MTHEVTVRTTHARPEVVAAAVAPDNTDEMSTRVDGAGEQVVTTIERDGAGGLRTTADDYVSNLTVAQQVIDAAGGDGSRTTSERDATTTDDDTTTTDDDTTTTDDDTTTTDDDTTTTDDDTTTQP